MGHFCPPRSGSGFRIQIRIHWPDWIRIRPLRKVFIRVYRLEIQSCWYFRPSFVYCCPTNLLSGSTLRPTTPFPVSKYSIYRQCVAGRERGVLSHVGDHIVTIFCRILTHCIWPDSEPTKLLDHPKKNYEGRGLRQINTCRNVPLQVNFFRWRHFALVSI